ncbi:MAG: hypothetical protein QOJ68_3847, partial [Blastococcus sp.]|nr:hypothetical protein [Blastococcus sp.]
MPDLQVRIRGSEESWRTTPPERRVPEALLPPRSGSPAYRLKAWRGRHLLRERRAQEYFAASRSPERGLPVAQTSAVVGFMGGLLRTRRAMVIFLLT